MLPTALLAFCTTATAAVAPWHQHRRRTHLHAASGYAASRRYYRCGRRRGKGEAAAAPAATTAFATALRAHRNDAPSPTPEDAQPPRSGSSSGSSSVGEAALAYFRLWNARELDAIPSYFSPDLSYEDALYPRPFRGRDALRRHLRKAAQAVPADLAFVVDDVCEDVARNKCAVRFHLESSATGKAVPFSRGTSFFSGEARTDGTHGYWITSGWDVPEPFLKAGNAILGLVRFASAVQRLLPSQQQQRRKEEAMHHDKRP